MSSSTNRLDLIRRILGTEEEALPGQKYQDPKIQIEPGKKPKYYIRPYVPIIDDHGNPDRQQKRLYLGIVGEISIREAKEEKKRIMLTINDNKFLVQSQIPFSLVLDRYIEVRLPNLPAVKDCYTNIIKKHIRPDFETMTENGKTRATRMCDIDKLMVERWLTNKAALKNSDGIGKYSHNSLLDFRKILSCVFTAAKEWGLWEGENPCWNLGKGKIGGVKKRYKTSMPDDAGLLRFLNNIDDTRIISREGAQLIVIVALVSGGRVCEVLGLQIKHLDLLQETIQIEQDWTRGKLRATKNEESERICQIPGLAMRIGLYTRGKGPEDFLFARPDTKLPPDDRDLQHHVFRPAAEEAKIYTPGFGLQRFRHISLTWKQQVGAHPMEAMKDAGHAQLSTTWLYTETDTERQKTHATRMLDRLIGAAGGRIQ